MSGVVEAFGRLIQAIQEVIAAPMANLGAAMLLLAALALLLLIVVTVLALLVLPSPKAPRAERVGAVEAQASRGSRKGSGRVFAIIVAVLVLAALIGGYVGTSTDGYCLSCHAERELTQELQGYSATTQTAAAAPLHAAVRCVACHEDALPLGLTGTVAARLRWAAKGFAGADAEGAEASVPARRCLRCHRTIMSRTTESTSTGVVMSHEEPVQAGVPCTDCHKNAGHSPGAQGVSMNTCLMCHDGTAAPAMCSTCHTKDTAFAVRQRRTFSFVHLPPVSDCGGCHDQKVCDACHGLRMPHPRSFIDGGHARYAGFEKKNLCWRCHQYTECGKCHLVKRPGEGAWGHGTGTWWRYEHGRVTPKGAQAGCGCHSRSPYARAGNYCEACH